MPQRFLSSSPMVTTLLTYCSGRFLRLQIVNVARDSKNAFIPHDFEKITARPKDLVSNPLPEGS